jgi:DNA-binding IclR family transcriptional regulator
MTDKADSSLARMLSVLDLFSEQRLHWSADAISEALQVSLPTGYRYVKMLTEAGLLQRSGDAQLTLGPRIIELDHYIRQADPVLQQGLPFMKELVALTGLDCVVSSLLGERLLDTHREYGSAPADLSYGRGRPRPLFLGAAPKVILAHLHTAQLRRLKDAHPD